MNEAKEKPKQYVCPECAAAGKNTVYAYGTALGSHRSRAHGVKGTSKSVLAVRRKKKKPLGRPRGSGKKTKALAKTKAYQQEASKAGVLVGYAMAQLEERAHEIARENGLQEKEFTRIVAWRLAEMTQQ